MKHISGISGNRFADETAWRCDTTACGGAMCATDGETARHPLRKLLPTADVVAGRRRAYCWASGMGVEPLSGGVWNVGRDKYQSLWRKRKASVSTLWRSELTAMMKLLRQGENSCASAARRERRRKKAGLRNEEIWKKSWLLAAWKHRWIYDRAASRDTSGCLSLICFCSQYSLQRLFCWASNASVEMMKLKALCLGRSKASFALKALKCSHYLCLFVSIIMRSDMERRK